VTSSRRQIGPGSTYEGAGVSIAAGEAVVDRIKPLTERATRPEVVGGIGGFASLVRLPSKVYQQPVLASASDGVGTKSAIAQAMDVHDTIGIDLVAMVVDDLVPTGAEPLFVQDYIACGKLDPDNIATIVGGIAEGCVRSGAALVGGETAEHPGLMDPDDYDLAATAVGVVESDDILGPERVVPGDVVIGMASSGMHANGFSMVRHVLLDIARLPLDGHVEEFGRTLGEELLEPCRIYAPHCLALGRECDAHGFAHVTGGGLAGNLSRVIPPGLTAQLDRRAWTPPPVFGYIAARGRVERSEMDRTFNMGVGMATIVPADEADRAMAVLTARHMPSIILGSIEPAADDAPDVRVVLSGDHPRF
jgi:phosphoribosylformylglycinamidine cyclo-ligase